MGRATGEEDQRRTFQSAGAEGRGAKGSIVHLLGEHQKVELGWVDRNWREECALENFLPLSTDLYVQL